ncbi:C-type lectin 37Db-like isoform X2 [Drosophila obscura]|uniref:C-type lectin 37Db-like isoform X2 n=1 Tax=Drosophila obscura TaxID=7282 RepID=UPI001BB1013F|nr:C-type lectin 37Db-like isoform X2 [Drosophila obscura]
MSTKSASLLLFMLIVLHLQTSFASDSSSESQCGGYCFFVLKPLLDHVAANQERWNACDAKLDRTESQLVVLQEKLSKIEAEKAAEGKLVEKPKVKQLDSFVQIGSRFFYIEQNHRVSWFSATCICRQMGGYLASPRSEEEWNGIKEKLTQNRVYWLGISDLANEGSYLSQATGNLAPFLKWKSGEPNDQLNNENCVEVRPEMNDNYCTLKNYFICEAGDES